MEIFESLKEKKLGFGVMRLPVKGDGYDMEEIQKMVDAYMDAGYNYFDTAYLYGTSEAALKEVLVSKYPRESFKLATKMNVQYQGIKSKEECAKYFDEQLERTGAGYFDFYLTHNIASPEFYEQCKEVQCFEFIKEKKAEGKIKHIGFSFHGGPELLKRVLDEQPQTEFVQIQLNYADWDSNSIYSGELYQILRERNIPVIAMEPIKGGSLANPLEDVANLLKKAAPERSLASWALRYVGSLENVVMILSGMSTLDQMQENLDTFINFTPLSDAEQAVINKAIDIMNNSNQIPCTRCRYCVDGCPKGIDIPEILTFTNEVRRAPNDWKAITFYGMIPSDRNASACIDCKKCETACPQHLEISELLKEATVELNV